MNWLWSWEVWSPHKVIIEKRVLRHVTLCTLVPMHDDYTSQCHIPEDRIFCLRLFAGEILTDWAQHGNSCAGGDMWLHFLPSLASSMYMLYVWISVLPLLQWQPSGTQHWATALPLLWVGTFRSNKTVKCGNTIIVNLYIQIEHSVGYCW